YTTDTAPAEGIGEGWFYSVLGGGVDARPPRQTGTRTSVAVNNTKLGGREAAVPTVSNGDFQSSIRPVLGRFPLLSPTWTEVPGWSFHGGSGDARQGLNLVWLADGPDLNREVPRFLLTPALNPTLLTPYQAAADGRTQYDLLQVLLLLNNQNLGKLPSLDGDTLNKLISPSDADRAEGMIKNNRVNFALGLGPDLLSVTHN